MDAQINGHSGPKEKPTPLKPFEVAIELYLFIQQAPRIAYTSRQLTREFNKHYNETLNHKRVKQICNALVERGRIKKTYQEHPRAKNLVPVYCGNDNEPIIINSEIWKLAQTIEKMSL